MSAPVPIVEGIVFNAARAQIQHRSTLPYILEDRVEKYQLKTKVRYKRLTPVTKITDFDYCGKGNFLRFEIYLSIDL